MPIFWEGLLSNEDKTNLRMRLSTIELKDLTKVAREIEQALPVRTPINFTQTINNSELSSTIDQLEKSLESMVLQINERFSRSQTPGRNVRFGRSKSRNRPNFRAKVETIEAQVAIMDIQITTEMLDLNLEVVIILNSLGVI